MEELAELKQQLTQRRPDGWDDLPDKIGRASCRERVWSRV